MRDSSTAGARATGSPALSGDQPLVSVVTPVYNGAAYIEECIESVLHQTYRNWEYTVVDNASTDATPDIVERYAGQHSRIRHLRFEELVNANENHNRAYRATNAASEYCKVVQADDWLFPECLARMVEVAEGASSVGVVSAYRLAGHQIDLTGIPYAKTVIGGHEVLADSLLRRYHVTGAPSALLYRSRLVLERDSFWDTAFEHADTEAAYRVLDRNDFGFVHQVLTYARRHQPGSRMTYWADVLNTYVPENVRFLIRYGPRVLDPDTYRGQLRFELRRYLWFHLRQLPKPSRLADPEFFAVHGAEIEAILRESGGDADVRSAMLLVKTMLLRGRRTQRVETALP